MRVYNARKRHIHKRTRSQQYDTSAMRSTAKPRTNAKGLVQNDRFGEFGTINWNFSYEPTHPSIHTRTDAPRCLHAGIRECLYRQLTLTARLLLRISMQFCGEWSRAVEDEEGARCEQTNRREVRFSGEL